MVERLRNAFYFVLGLSVGFILWAHEASDIQNMLTAMEVHIP